MEKLSMTVWFSLVFVQLLQKPSGVFGVIQLQNESFSTRVQTRGYSISGTPPRSRCGQSISSVQLQSRQNTPHLDLPIPPCFAIGLEDYRIIFLSDPFGSSPFLHPSISNWDSSINMTFSATHCEMLVLLANPQVLGLVSPPEKGLRNC